MSDFTENTLKSWIAELGGPLEDIDWSVQASAWNRARAGIVEPLHAIVGDLQEGRVVMALEKVVDHPQILEIAGIAPDVDPILGETEDQPLGISNEWVARLANTELRDDGPVLTAYRFAIRSGDSELSQRCRRLIERFSYNARQEDELGLLFDQWAKALGDADTRRSAEREHQAMVSRMRTSRKKRVRVIALSSLAIVSLGVGSLYLTVRSQFVEAIDLFANQIEQGTMEAQFQGPDSFLPVEIYPDLQARLESVREARSALSREYAEVQQLISKFEAKIFKDTNGSLDVALESVNIRSEIVSLPLQAQGPLLDQLEEAIAWSRASKEEKIAKQEAEFEPLLNLLEDLEEAIVGDMNLDGLRTWLPRAQGLGEKYDAWKAVALDGVDVEAGAEARIEAIVDRGDVIQSLLDEMSAALASVSNPNSYESVQSGIERLAGLNSSGIQLPDLARAERSLPFWRERLVPEAWTPSDTEARMWIERSASLKLEDFSYAREVATQITQLLTDDSFIDVWQYFRYNYAGAQSSSLVYTQGPVESEETLLDELRELYLVSQELTLVDQTGASSIKSTANKDGLGRYRGIVYDDGILTLESRVAKQLADLWDADYGAFKQNPLPLIQTAIYDARLSPAFRAFMLQWTVDVLGSGQEFFEISWIPELKQAKSLLAQSGIVLNHLSWLEEKRNQQNLDSLLGSAPSYEWVDSQKATSALLAQFESLPLAFVGTIGPNGLTSVEGVDIDEARSLYLVLDSETSTFVPLAADLKSERSWLPVLSTKRPSMQGISTGDLSYPEPTVFWDTLKETLPEGLRDALY
ncbi:MAG: hypothetical protein ACPGN3_05890 [Opitutales bacterium]